MLLLVTISAVLADGPAQVATPTGNVSFGVNDIHKSLTPVGSLIIMAGMGAILIIIGSILIRLVRGRRRL